MYQIKIVFIKYQNIYICQVYFRTNQLKEKNSKIFIILQRYA